MKVNGLLIALLATASTIFGAAEPQVPPLNEMPELVIQTIGHFADDRTAVHLAKTARRLGYILKPDIDKRAELLRQWHQPIEEIYHTYCACDKITKPIFSPDGKIIAVPAEDGFWLCAVQTGKFAHKLFNPNEETKLLSFIKTDPNKILLKEITEKHARTWEITKKANEETYDATVIDSLEIPDFYNHVMAVSPDGTTIATEDDDGTLHILKNGECHIYQFTKYTTIITALAFSADSKLLAIGTTRGTVSILNLDTNEKSEMNTYYSSDSHAHVSSVLFSNDQNYLAASFTQNGLVRGGFMVWDLRTNDLLVNYTLCDVISLAISPDNRIIAAGLENGGLNLVNLIKKCEFKKREFHASEIEFADKYPEFSPDGQSIAIIDSLGDFGLWRPTEQFSSNQYGEPSPKRARIETGEPKELT